MTGMSLRVSRWTVAATVALACALGGCTVQFGAGGDDTRSENPRDRNRTYLQEQERMERDRQRFDPIWSSER
jgi:hypothetical protein